MNVECGFGFIIQHSSFSIHSALILHPSSFVDTMTDQSKQKTFFAKLKRGLFMTHTEIIDKVKESILGSHVLYQQQLAQAQPVSAGAAPNAAPN